MKLFLRHLLALTIGLFPSQLVACETAPDISQLPGETVKQAQERFAKTFSDQNVIRDYELETYSFKNATTIYIAKVVSSNRDRLKSDPERPALLATTVQPIRAIKGSLPASGRHLSVSSQTSCGDRGDGEATLASVGTLVVVFEGLPKSDWHPNGINSLIATSARTFELLDPLLEFGKPLSNPWGH